MTGGRRLTSWVPGADGSGFPAEHLPYGVFAELDAGAGTSAASATASAAASGSASASASSASAAAPAKARAGRPGLPRVGARIGDRVLDLARLAQDGLVDGPFDQPSLNPFMATGPQRWSAVRARLIELVCDETWRARVEPTLLPLSQVELSLPFTVGDYVDFYSSIEHATNLGRLFRPDAEPLLPNWRHLPVAYHGRSGTVVVSGTPVVRPSGQRLVAGPAGSGAGAAPQPGLGPSLRLDIELEVGFVIGTGSLPGRPVPVGEAAAHVFGVVLVNDWSARDIQAWEYQPLGPFLGKSFATSVAAWVTPLDALVGCRVEGPPQDPPPLDYLALSEPWGLDLDLAVELAPVGTPDGAGSQVISSTGFDGLYWRFPQQIAHMTVNGAHLRTGDLIASGTVSGPTRGSEGSLIELTRNGAEPLDIAGVPRSFLEDGDEVVLTGRADVGDGVTLALGEVRGRILPPMVTASLHEYIRAAEKVVGAAHVLTDPADTAGYVTDWTRRWTGATPAVLRPADATEVAEVVVLARTHRVALVPQGGNTGLVGGGVPLAGEVVLSLGRLSTIEPVDRLAGQVTVGAGVTLGALQAAAAAAGWAFGVDLAARDSATLGGMIGTNAGGLNVVRHGALRAQVIGVEAVLGTGAVVQRLSGLVKDNTGYDLAQLLCGSEGTLGVVTRARLRLVPPPGPVAVALLGLPSMTAAVALAAALRVRLGGVRALEAMTGDSLRRVALFLDVAVPTTPDAAAYLLVEAESPTPTADPALTLAEALHHAAATADAAVGQLTAATDANGMAGAAGAPALPDSPDAGGAAAGLDVADATAPGGTDAGGTVGLGTADGAADLPEADGATAADADAGGRAGLAGAVEEAAVATSAGERERLWRLREAQPEAAAALGVVHKLDVTLPTAQLAGFCDDVVAEIARRWPAATTFLYGHVGDGNVHVNVVGGPESAEIDDRVLEQVVERGGSISAEHGIGVAKKRWLTRDRSPAELDAMRAIKHALDPDGILNPNVLLP